MVMVVLSPTIDVWSLSWKFCNCRKICQNTDRNVLKIFWLKRKVLLWIAMKIVRLMCNPIELTNVNQLTTVRTIVTTTAVNFRLTITDCATKKNYMMSTCYPGWNSGRRWMRLHSILSKTLLLHLYIFYG